MKTNNKLQHMQAQLRARSVEEGFDVHIPIAEEFECGLPYGNCQCGRKMCHCPVCGSGYIYMTNSFNTRLDPKSGEQRRYPIVTCRSAKHKYDGLDTLLCEMPPKAPMYERPSKVEKMVARIPPNKLNEVAAGLEEFKKRHGITTPNPLNLKSDEDL
jgi:hypothetical protein